VAAFPLREYKWPNKHFFASVNAHLRS
jgi:hypothetical protein